MLWILLLLVLYLVLGGTAVKASCAVTRPPLIVDENVGMLGYKTKNFGISHGMSKKMFESMKQSGMRDEKLKEFCDNNNYTYKVLAVSFFSKQVAVKLICDS